VLSLVVAACLLALVWPLTGYLERRGYHQLSLVAIHAGTAILFTLGWQSFIYAVLYLMQIPIPSEKITPYGLVWPFLFYMMMYGLIAGAFHAMRAGEAARLQSLATVQAQSLLVVSELAALRNKLNPHFLFNTLHSIIALTRKNSPAAQDALLKFSDMLRYVLDTEKSGNDRVTLDDEMRFVRDYLDLESLRLGARLTVEWDIDAAAAYHCLPALTVQPLVENSIKHAFNPRSQPGRLIIRTRVNAAASQLTISVSDNGPGAQLALVRQSDGLGIRTVERRLQLEYGARAAFRIDTSPGAGFDVSLSIPLDAV
jgi:LytS/YehU family sensor histidine kinase